MKRRKLTPFGILVRKRLLDLGMTQVQLAEQLGTTKNYLNRIMSGERSGKKYLSNIISILNLDPECYRKIA